MYFNKSKYSAVALLILSALSSNSTFAGAMGPQENFPKGHFIVQIGGYSAVQGVTQDAGPAGNQYTVENNNEGSGLVGIGYFLDGARLYDRAQISYGINAFFLGQTSVKGYVVEDNSFTNLSYGYKLESLPFYLDVKTAVDTSNPKFKLVFDAGVGPNFISASGYNEMSLNKSTLTANTFSNRNNVAFSATAGAGIRFSNNPQLLPIECGYRFFYLGQGELAVVNNGQVANPLKTGNSYANALTCSLTI